MKNARYLVFGAAFIALLVLLSAENARSVYSSPVTVSNTPLSVQQQGPVDTSGSNINVVNTPTVNLAGGTAVTIAGNDATHPVQVRDVDNPARMAYNIHCTPVRDAVQLNEASCSILLPEGYRFVAEHIDVTARSTGVGNPMIESVQVDYTLNGSPETQVYPAADVSTLGRSMLSSVTRFYADPGSNLRILISAQETRIISYPWASVSGYLVKM